MAYKAHCTVPSLHTIYAYTLGERERCVCVIRFRFRFRFFFLLFCIYFLDFVS